MTQADRIRRFPILPVLLTGLCLLPPACSALPFPAPTPTPTATRTPTVTPPPSPTATPAATLAPSQTAAATVSCTEWPVSINETFDLYDGIWHTGHTDDEYCTADISIVGGKYLLKISSKRGLHWRFTAHSTSIPIPDYYVSVDVKVNRAPPGADYGLVIRAWQNSYYYFAINASARYYAVLAFRGGKWFRMIGWKHDGSIAPDRANNLAIAAYITSFAVFLTGKQVDSFEEDTIYSGRVGVGVTIPSGGQYLEIEFDNFVVREP
ncbi:MAG: hypothetical protein JW929_04125 [Anaerolineales bacterium]|nr:hypothetical protein [Anaerolineales bacterium]